MCSCVFYLHFWFKRYNYKWHRLSVIVQIIITIAYSIYIEKCLQNVKSIYKYRMQLKDHLCHVELFSCIVTMFQWTAWQVWCGSHLQTLGLIVHLWVDYNVSCVVPWTIFISYICLQWFFVFVFPLGKKHGYCIQLALISFSFLWNSSHLKAVEESFL